MRKKLTKISIVALLAIFLIPTNSFGFWVVNFGTARTLHKGKFGFAAGMGGQMVFLGQPKLTSGFFTIPHAGFRYGLGERIDAGLRLAPIPLPFSTVGPGFGVNLDVKYCFTKPESKFDFGVVVGFGGAHVLIEEKTRYAYSPNAALLGTVLHSHIADYLVTQKKMRTILAHDIIEQLPWAFTTKENDFIT